jgi:hypothetical protein
MLEKRKKNLDARRIIDQSYLELILSRGEYSKGGTTNPSKPVNSNPYLHDEELTFLGSAETLSSRSRLFNGNPNAASAASPIRIPLPASICGAITHSVIEAKSGRILFGFGGKGDKIRIRQRSIMKQLFHTRMQRIVLCLEIGQAMAQRILFNVTPTSIWISTMHVSAITGSSFAHGQMA